MATTIDNAAIAMNEVLTDNKVIKAIGERCAKASDRGNSVYRRMLIERIRRMIDNGDIVTTLTPEQVYEQSVRQRTGRKSREHGRIDDFRAASERVALAMRRDNDKQLDVYALGASFLKAFVFDNDLVVVVDASNTAVPKYIHATYVFRVSHAGGATGVGQALENIYMLFSVGGLMNALWKNKSARTLLTKVDGEPAKNKSPAIDAIVERLRTHVDAAATEADASLQSWLGYTRRIVHLGERGQSGVERYEKELRSLINDPDADETSWKSSFDKRQQRRLQRDRASMSKNNNITIVAANNDNNAADEDEEAVDEETVDQDGERDDERDNGGDEDASSNNDADDADDAGRQDEHGDSQEDEQLAPNVRPREGSMDEVRELNDSNQGGMVAMTIESEAAEIFNMLLNTFVRNGAATRETFGEPFIVYRPGSSEPDVVMPFAKDCPGMDMGRLAMLRMSIKASGFGLNWIEDYLDHNELAEDGDGDGYGRYNDSKKRSRDVVDDDDDDQDDGDEVKIISSSSSSSSSKRAKAMSDHDQFCADMKAAGYEVRPYSGRFLWSGPAVVVRDRSAAMAATSVCCRSDNMGFDFVVYPCSYT